MKAVLTIYFLKVIDPYFKDYDIYHPTQKQ